MTGFYIELAIILLGFGAAALLFFRIPRLPKQLDTQSSLRVCVVIPARNEAHTLPLLLADLTQQTLQPYQIIVADDDSEDATSVVARSFGAEVLTLRDKPSGWIGKNWACQNGADAAKGDVLLFLDADVRMAPNGLARIVSAFAAGGTVSVQPFHQTQRAYEQCSLIFNMVHLSANGSALPKPVNIGLFGPVIAISLEHYLAAGGHAGVHTSVVEDMALAEKLRQANIPFRVFIGDTDVSFRMYPSGFRSLWQGFSKNLATGAAKTPPWLFLLVTLLLASITSVPLHLACSIARGEKIALLYAALYALWIGVLFLVSRRIGRYRPLAVLLYPAPLVVFMLVFVYSGALRLFRRNVKWKGRAIPLER